MLIRLFNFDHGLTVPKIFRIGPYEIVVDQSHCDSLGELPRRASNELTYDSESLQRVVLRKEAKKGRIVETAQARRPDIALGSTLIRGRPLVTSDFDLQMLLSFLTGRRVYLEEELDNEPSISFGEPIVGSSFFQSTPPNLWAGLDRLGEQELGDALYCVVNAPLAPEIIGRGGYVNAALDALITSWASINGKTKFPERHKLDAVHDKLIAPVHELVNRLCSEEEVDPTVADDIVARFKSLSNAPSAIAKLTSYLVAVGLLSANRSDEVTKRVKGLNIVRNGIAHSGTIRLEKGLGVEQSDRVGMACVLLIEDIAGIALAEVLDISDRAVQRTKKIVWDFFETGTFRNQKIFDEAFDGFMDRTENEWIKEGRMPG